MYPTPVSCVLACTCMQTSTYHIGPPPPPKVFIEKGQIYIFFLGAHGGWDVPSPHASLMHRVPLPLPAKNPVYETPGMHVHVFVGMHVRACLCPCATCMHMCMCMYIQCVGVRPFVAYTAVRKSSCSKETHH